MEQKNCSNCDQKTACVPFFLHENAMMHYNRANHRMLIALIVVCATFLLTIAIFVSGYTAREKNWLDTLMRLTPEVQSGIYKQSDQGAD